MHRSLAIFDRLVTVVLHSCPLRQRKMVRNFRKWLLPS